jgi:hypothetical protein
MEPLRKKLSRTLRMRSLVASLAIALSASPLAASTNSQLGRIKHPATNTDAKGHPFGPELSAFRSAASRNSLQPETVLLVENCDDAGPDSLRAVVDAANTLSGDVTIQFDVNAMQCSTITLTSGEIKITKDDLSLQGPGLDVLTIDGGYSEGHYNRIFDHTGIGTLAISGLNLTDAKYVSTAGQSAFGGCITGYAVHLLESTVSHCVAFAPAGDAYGGAIAARFSILVVDSTISNSHAVSSVDRAGGGGIFAGSVAGGSFTVKYSTIEQNTAHTYGQNAQTLGGGILANGPQSALIQRSTISGNQADNAGGAYVVRDLTLSDTTVSQNIAGAVAGVEVGQAATLYSSTVVSNHATVFGRTAGLDAQSVESNSSIFAFNVTDDGNGGIERDVKSGDGMISGANDLIMAAAMGTGTPAGTLSACPRLGALLSNGGSTRTHALLPSSPAIDNGNNSENLDTDQRGTGFDRVIGANADIGAYEFRAGSGDEINRSSFETCE